MLTVRELIDLYLRHSEIEGVHCREVLADRRHALGLFVEAYGDVPVAECKAFHLTDWIESHPTWKSVSTRRSRSNAVRAAFQWATDGERIARNPFHKVRYAEAERRPELPDEVFERIAQLANKPFERVLRWLRFTGCRLSEMCRAVWEDIDLERGLWTIHFHKSKKTTGKPKVVALVPEAVAMLKAMDRTDALIFLNNRGKQWNRRLLDQQLRRMKRKYGIDCKATLHGIRHRFAGAAVAAGAPIKLIAAQLGHSSVLITEKYYIDLNGQMEAVKAAAALAMPKKSRP